MNRILVAAFLVCCLAGCPEGESPFAKKWEPERKPFSLGDMKSGPTPKVKLETSIGDVIFSLYPPVAPGTVENFLKLCKQGFYDGTKFHRVIRNFMIQGGDPNSNDDSKTESWGLGNPGYTVPAEFSDLSHVRGTLSMARGSDPDSAGSQFFVVHKDSPQLDKQYTAFGNLEKGADVLDAIASVQVTGPSQSPRPVQPVILLSTVILPAKK